MKSNNSKLAYLKDISNILREHGGDGLRPEEFTTAMFKEEYEKANGKTTNDAVLSRLKRMVENGKLSKRKITLSGSSTNAYKRNK